MQGVQNLRDPQGMPAAPEPAGLEAVPELDSEHAVMQWLSRRGVPVVPAQLTQQPEEAVAVARRLGTPVVLKIASRHITHKTEVRGVTLNLAGDKAVAQGWVDLNTRVRAARPDAEIDGVLVSPMRLGGIELLVGTLRDPQWGAALVVGLGGVWVEALRDTSLRLLPVARDDVLEMLDELRGARLLDGWRGAPAADRDALAEVIVAIGRAALALGPELVSLEVNPLRVHGSEIEALDALAVWDRPQ